MKTKLSTRPASRKQRGQGMTEYIIIVALVAIGAIAVYNFFGHTVQDQMAAVANGLAGQQAAATGAEGDAGGQAGKAAGQAKKAYGMKDFADQTMDH